MSKLSPEFTRLLKRSDQGDINLKIFRPDLATTRELPLTRVQRASALSYTGLPCEIVAMEHFGIFQRGSIDLGTIAAFHWFCERFKLDPIRTLREIGQKIVWMDIYQGIPYSGSLKPESFLS